MYSLQYIFLNIHITCIILYDIHRFIDGIHCFIHDVHRFMHGISCIAQAKLQRSFKQYAQMYDISKNIHKYENNK